jgi:two-component system sensor histidine kinase YesM
MVSLFSNFKSQEILREQAGERTRGAMTSSMEYIDITLQSVEHLSTLIATDSNLIKLLDRAHSKLTHKDIYDFSRILKEITNVMTVNNNLSSISLLHAPSQMVLSTNFGGKRIPGIGEQPWVDQAFQGRGASVLYIPSDDFIIEGDIIFSNDSISIMRTMDLYNPQRISNILIINIKKSALLNLTKALLPSKNAQIYLISDNNEIVASTDKKYDPLYLQEDMLTVQVKSRYSNWTLVMVQPEKELYAESRQISLFMYIIIGVSIVLALWISWIVYSGISSPLESLSYGMKQLRIGNLNIQLPNRRKDELGYLTSGFNQMVLDQKHLIEDYYEQQLRLSKTELNFLQSQINPHFLYNTLDSIYWTAKNYEAEEISEMVLNLSKFFRLSLHKGKETFTVQETIENLHYYIRVQQLRFNDQFTVIYQIADESKPIPVLKLLLQHLV